MNTTQFPTPLTSSRIKIAPDFSGRPARINLEKLTAVKGHGKLNIRPIQRTDEPAMIGFHQHISEESIYMRYFEYLGLDRRTSHERLVRICTNTPQSYALVVEKPASITRDAEILAVGRLTTTPKSEAATFDMLLADEAQSPGMAKALLKRLIKVAGAFGFRALTSELLVVDHDTLNLCHTLGFTPHMLGQSGIVVVTLEL